MCRDFRLSGSVGNKERVGQNERSRRPHRPGPVTTDFRGWREVWPPAGSIIGSGADTEHKFGCCVSRYRFGTARYRASESRRRSTCGRSEAIIAMARSFRARVDSVVVSAGRRAATGRRRPERDGRMVIV